jgi:hypothetical protein
MVALNRRFAYKNSQRNVIIGMTKYFNISYSWRMMIQHWTATLLKKSILCELGSQKRSCEFEGRQDKLVPDVEGARIMDA